MTWLYSALIVLLVTLLVTTIIVQYYLTLWLYTSAYRIRSILGQIEFSVISQETVSNQLQLWAQVELKISSVYLQLGALFSLVK